MSLKYHQYCTGQPLQLLPTLHGTSTWNTTNTTLDTYLKYYQHYTWYVLEKLPTLNGICTSSTINTTYTTGYVPQILPTLHLTFTWYIINITPDMYLKYYQSCTGYVLQLLPTLHGICTLNTSNITFLMYLKNYQH